MTWRFAALVLACFWGGTAPLAAAEHAQQRLIEVRSAPITNFRIGSSETRFGALEFIGGFTMRADDKDFGQLSGLRFLVPGQEFIGVADIGFWFFGLIARDERGVPLGVRNFRLQPMVDGAGRIIADKRDKDAEAITLKGDRASVAFERNARITEYRLDPHGMGKPLRDLDFVVPRRELRNNAGFEALATAPQTGHLQGARIAITERSIDEDGNIFAAILEGPHKGQFKVLRTDDFDVTDASFLPDGHLLLLERRFSPLMGVAIRLRRIDGGTIIKGALVDGETLMQADLAYQIDNMEAMDVWQRDDGATILSMMSDNNQSILQRTLYLEFRLIE